MKTIPISDATDEQLKIFAIRKGLTFQSNTGRDKLVGKIKAVIEGEDIEVDDGAAAPAPAATAPAQDFEHAADPAKVSAEAAVSQQVGGQGATFQWVLILESDAEDGHEPVWLACNGKGIWVPRGKWCSLRQGYVESLKNAREGRYEMMKDPETGKDVINPEMKYSPRFPHQLWRGAGEPPREDQYQPKETAGNANDARPQAA